MFKCDHDHFFITTSYLLLTRLANPTVHKLITTT